MTETAGHDHCLRPSCGRKLTSEVSRARGYGHGCWRKLRVARSVARDVLAEAYTPDQLARADELIEDAALIPAAVVGYFLAVSTDGTEVYTTSPEICFMPREQRVLPPRRRHHDPRRLKHITPFIRSCRILHRER